MNTDIRMNMLRFACSAQQSKTKGAGLTELRIKIMFQFTAANALERSFIRQWNQAGTKSIANLRNKITIRQTQAIKSNTLIRNPKSSCIPGRINSSQIVLWQK